MGGADGEASENGSASNGGSDATKTEDDDESSLRPEDKIDFDGLKSLSDQGIDMSFLDNLKSEYESTMECNKVRTRIQAG